MAVFLVISALSDRRMNQAVMHHAATVGEYWGRYMSSHISDIETLLATGVPTEDQIKSIGDMRAVANVFRFKLFDDQGRLVLISDDEFVANPQGVAPEADPDPRMVLETMKPIVSVNDGTLKPDRPDIYAEAYVPIIGADGAPLGVAEVYLDETETRAYFVDSFNGFGIIVAGLSAFLFLAPALGFIVQKERALRTQKQIEYLARFDTLTGLMNRAEFKRRFDAALAEGSLSAVLYIDADRFKSINDTYGHGVGDEFLSRLGRILSANTAADDLVARFGGDEFVVALRNINPDMILTRIHKILTLSAETFTVRERVIACSVSIGVSLFEEGKDFDELTAEADAALYAAKSGGRNQYAFYGEKMGSEIRHRNMIEARVKVATENEEFTIVYQPLVDGQTHEVLGYEALLRLKADDGTAIPPMEFIPLAEEMGYVERLGSWTIAKAIRDISEFDGSSCVAINLSVAQFRSGTLPDVVREALEAVDFAPERLEVEITESLLLIDDPSISYQIDMLREMGVKIAMDDFGTKYSSLGYLWKYRFDRLKIDRSFISGLTENPERTLEIVESVIMLGKRLGMQVTAEGVETQAQSAILTELGCDVLQGFLFGRPEALDPADATEIAVPKVVQQA
ncbi:putative bifunctional diguanylate cyclase/phosphodiesterase [Poseidonocella sedimentorum]|nr:EAL domain-containing protein [Poseidonocella sedimentorum]